jgi:hypothetical protein
VKRENDGGVNLRHILNTFVNITMYPPVKLLNANKTIKKKVNRVDILSIQV